MVEFSRKLTRLKTLQKNLFKRKSAKPSNHEDAISTKQIEDPDPLVPTLAFQERAPADGEGSMAGERAQTQPNGQDEGSVGIDLLQKEEGGSAPETVLQDNMPEPHEALPSPGVPFTNVGSSSETPQSVSAVQPELRNNVLLSPISEEPAVDVLKFKAALNPIGEDLLGQSLLGLAGSERERDRLSPLTHTDDLVHPRGEVQPVALYSLSKEWMADDPTMAQRTALGPVASNGSAEGGWNQGNGFTVSTEPVAVDETYPDTTYTHDQNGTANATTEDPYQFRDVQSTPLGSGGTSSLRDDKQPFDTGTDDPEALLKRFEKQVIPGPAFTGAHGFVINKPLFLNVNRATDKLMKLLYRKSLPNTSLNSDARSPPPLCLRGTREVVRTRILTWVADRNRKSNLLWLYGPAGAGTSAVAQTIAEYCKAQRRLGAAFFFPRVFQKTDRTRVIPSLAYQLAAAFPAYKNYITSLLDLDRSVLEGALRTQFQKLISEPLSTINASPEEPILIVLDGLNNLKDNTFQWELIELVGKFAVKANLSGLPFIWIIASRRERNIALAFEANPSISLQREELPINTRDAKQDVSKFVRYNFQKIRQKHYDVVPDGNMWPAEDHLSMIDSRSSGLFAFASSIIEFVDGDNPVAKLRDCLAFLKNRVIPSSGNPLEPLHSIYQEVLNDVPQDNLPFTKRILSFLALGARAIPAHAVADFLILDHSAFYGGLARLHSVLDVPAPVIATNSPLMILHASLNDFVRDKIKSGDFELDLQATASNIAAIEERCFKRYVQWGAGGLHGVLPSPWYREDPESNVMKFSMRELWLIWCNKSEEEMPQLCKTLRQFNFSGYDHVNGKLEKLAPMKDIERYMTKFLHGLSKWQNEYGTGEYPILRSESRCPTDGQLLKQYQHLIGHARMKKFDFYHLKTVPERWCYKVLSVSTDDRSGPRECPNMLRVFSTSQLVYFLLGHDTNSCLVIAYQAI